MSVLIGLLGAYEQWGYCESTGTVQKHSFVLPFAKECWHCSVIPWKTPNSGYCSVAYTVSKAEFESYYYQATRTVSNCYIAIGVQQWGNAGNGGGSVDVTFPISFTKTVYQIQLTCNSDSYENPVYAIKDTKSFSYWSKYGGDKLWFALGMQQWGVVTSYDVTVNFPVAYSTQIFCLTAFHSASDTSTLDLYAEHVMLNGFNFAVAAPDNAYKSFERGYWLSIGV